MVSQMSCLLYQGSKEYNILFRSSDLYRCILVFLDPDFYMQGGMGCREYCFRIFIQKDLSAQGGGGNSARQGLTWLTRVGPGSPGLDSRSPGCTNLSILIKKGESRKEETLKI